MAIGRDEIQWICDVLIESILEEPDDKIVAAYNEFHGIHLSADEIRSVYEKKIFMRNHRIQ